MQIRAYGPFLVAKDWPMGAVAFLPTLAEGPTWADVISVHLPEADRPILRTAELVQMQPGAMVINTARGGIFDEAALAQALHSGQIGAAGLDVFDAEPPATDRPLLSFARVILTPHIAGLTSESAERMALAPVQNMLDFFAGKLDLELVVNRTALA